MISPSLARMMVQEHLYRPISGNVITLGRQWIGMTHEEAVSVLQGAGLNIPPAVIESTRGSIETHVRYAADRKYITDQALFKMFGVDRVYSLDVTDYENCDIIHDLNYPIPADLRGKYDFILDGGTFDHLVDIKQSFINLVDMLKPGGRTFMYNAASNFTGAAYLSFGPDFFEDYFLINKFNDVKVYIAEGASIGQLYDWEMYYYDSLDGHGQFESDKIQMVIVMAEKAADSTNDRIPIQAQYRDEARTQDFVEGRKRVQQSSRPVLLGRIGEQTRPKAPHAASKVGMLARLCGGLKDGTVATQPARAAPKGFRYIGKI